MKKLKHLYTLALLLSAMLLLTACEINLDNLFPEIHITSRRPRESNAESFNWNYEFTDSEELTSQSETSHEYDPSSNYVSSGGVSSETPSVSVDPEPPVVPEPISSETFISSSCISSEAPASSVEPKPPVPEPDDPQTKYEPFLLQIRHGTFPAFGQVTLIKRDFNSMLEYMSRYTPASISNIECFGATYATVILEDAYGGEYTDPEIICKMFELAGKIVLGDAYLAPEKSLEYIYDCPVSWYFYENGAVYYCPDIYLQNEGGRLYAYCFDGVCRYRYEIKNSDEISETAQEIYSMITNK